MDGNFFHLSWDRIFFPQSTILKCCMFYGAEGPNFLTMIYFDVAPAAVLGSLIHNAVLYIGLVTEMLTNIHFSDLFWCLPLSFHIFSWQGIKLSTNLLVQCLIDLNSSGISQYHIHHHQMFILHQQEQHFWIWAEIPNILILYNPFSHKLTTFYFGSHSEVLPIFICDAFFSSFCHSEVLPIFVCDVFFSSFCIICCFHLPPFLYPSLLLCVSIYPLLKLMAYHSFCGIFHKVLVDSLHAYLTGCCATGQNSVWV